MKNKTEKLPAISTYDDVEERLERYRKRLFRAATKAYKQMKKEQEVKDENRS